VPERGPLRRRPDQQLPIDRGGAGPHPAGTATARAGRGRRATTVGRWTRGPTRAAIERCPAPRACATRAFPIVSVLSARRTVSAVGSRIWVTWQSAQRARRGVTVTVSAPMPRTVRVRPLRNERSAPRHRGQGRPPASRVSSAHLGMRHHHPDIGLHSCQPALPTTADVNNGHFVLQDANSHWPPSRRCRPNGRSAHDWCSPTPATSRHGRFP
jgi:hypothetical protein